MCTKFGFKVYKSHTAVHLFIYIIDLLSLYYFGFYRWPGQHIGTYLRHCSNSSIVKNIIYTRLHTSFIGHVIFYFAFFVFLYTFLFFSPFLILFTRRQWNKDVEVHPNCRSVVLNKIRFIQKKNHTTRRVKYIPLKVLVSQIPKTIYF